MANTVYLASNVNFLEKTLSGTINDTAATITLNNTTSVKVPGYAVINRVNSAGVATPNSREVISYTGISGNDLTLTGEGLSSATGIKVSQGANERTLTIGSKTSSFLVADLVTTMQLIPGQVFSIIISSASADVVVNAVFSVSNDSISTAMLQDASVTLAKLSGAGVANGQTLKFNGSIWVPTNAGQVYIGGYNANTNIPD